jgi:hypothetical protein
VVSVETVMKRRHQKMTTSTGNQTAGGLPLVAHSDVPAEDKNSHGQPDPTKWNYAGCRVRNLKTGKFSHTMRNGVTDNQNVIRVYTAMGVRTG